MRSSGTTNSSRTEASGSCRSKDRQVSRSTTGIIEPVACRCGLKVAGAPGGAIGREHGVGTGDAAGANFVDTSRCLERAEPIAAQIEGSQVGHIQLQVRAGIRSVTLGTGRAAR